MKTQRIEITPEQAKEILDNCKGIGDIKTVYGKNKAYAEVDSYGFATAIILDDMRAPLTAIVPASVPFGTEAARGLPAVFHLGDDDVVRPEGGGLCKSDEDEMLFDVRIDDVHAFVARLAEASAYVRHQDNGPRHWAYVTLMVGDIVGVKTAVPARDQDGDFRLDELYVYLEVFDMDANLILQNEKDDTETYRWHLPHVSELVKTAFVRVPLGSNPL